jgi:hypothetical protein
VIGRVAATEQLIAGDARRPASCAALFTDAINFRGSRLRLGSATMTLLWSGSQSSTTVNPYSVHV